MTCAPEPIGLFRGVHEPIFGRRASHRHRTTLWMAVRVPVARICARRSTTRWS